MNEHDKILNANSECECQRDMDSPSAAILTLEKVLPTLDLIYSPLDYSGSGTSPGSVSVVRGISCSFYFLHDNNNNVSLRAFP